MLKTPTTADFVFIWITPNSPNVHPIYSVPLSPRTKLPSYPPPRRIKYRSTLHKPPVAQNNHKLGVLKIITGKFSTTVQLIWKKTVAAELAAGRLESAKLCAVLENTVGAS